MSKGILGEKKIKVAEFWIKTQKVRTFFLLNYAYMWYKKRLFPETLQTSRTFCQLSKIDKAIFFLFFCKQKVFPANFLIIFVYQEGLSIHPAKNFVCKTSSKKVIFERQPFRKNLTFGCQTSRQNNWIFEG